MEGVEDLSKLGARILRIIILILVIFTVILGSACFYSFNKEYRQLRNEAKNSIEKFVVHVDGEKLQTVINEKNMDSGEFEEIYDAMARAKGLYDFKYTYTLGRKNDTTGYFIVDASSDSEDLGKEYPLEDEMKEAFSGKIVVTRKAYTDELGTFISAYAPVRNSSGEVIAIAGGDKDVTGFQNIKASLFKYFIIAWIIGLMISAIICFVFSRRVSAAIKMIRNGLNSMAEGDLTKTIQIRSRDEFEEIGKSINEFGTNISKILGSIKNMSDTIDDTSLSVTANIQEVSASTEEILSSLDEVSMSIQNQTEISSNAVDKMDMLSDNIGKAVLGIKNIYDLSHDSRELNGKQQHSMEDLMTTYKNSKEIAGKVSQQVNLLNEKAEEIGSITDMIAAISGQTNLLALNAAIEAARAGESGRGFAVVSDEIGSLAEQSATSARKISELIQNIQGTIKGTVENIELNRKSTEEQYRTVMKVAEDFNRLYENINTIISKISTTEASINEITSSKDAVISIIDEINSMIKQDAETMEEIRASVEEESSSINDISSRMTDLASKADKLNDSISIFRI